MVEFHLQKQKMYVFFSMAEMSIGRNVRDRNVRGRNVLAETSVAEMSVAEMSEHQITISTISVKQWVGLVRLHIVIWKISFRCNISTQISSNETRLTIFKQPHYTLHTVYRS